MENNEKNFNVTIKNNPLAQNKIRGFMEAGYSDYIAARFLLNNNFCLQGAILACTAIEKYLKAIIVFTNPNKTIKRIHIDNLNRLKDHFIGSIFEDFLDNFDAVFLEELKNIYSFRYFDNFKEPTSIGFLVNQFLGELDFIVTYINNRVHIKNSDGTLQGTPYLTDANTHQKNLWDNNYVLLKLDKTEFMNRETHGFCYLINPGNQNATMKTKYKIVPGQQMLVGKTSIELPKYEGTILPFRMDIKVKK